MTTERDGHGERCQQVEYWQPGEWCKCGADDGDWHVPGITGCRFEIPGEVDGRVVIRRGFIGYEEQQAEPRAEPAGVPEGAECPALFVPNTYNGKHRFELHLGGAHRLCVFCNMPEQTAKWVAESLAAATARAERAEGALRDWRELIYSTGENKNLHMWFGRCHWCRHVTEFDYARSQTLANDEEASLLELDHESDCKAIATLRTTTPAAPAASGDAHAASTTETGDGDAH